MPFFLVLLLLFAAVPSPAAEGEQLDADIRMFSVLAAINAAGYDDGLGARGDSAVRQAVRQELADFDGPSLELLRNAYSDFRLDDPDANLGQWVSYAMVCAPPPTFELIAELPTDLPPEVRRLRGFGRVLEQFYREADLEGLWQKYQPAYEQELDRYSRALAPMLFQTAGYLRISNQSREFQGFQVRIDLLGAPGALNTRLDGGEIRVVVHPHEEIPLEEIRRAFLIHLLDRLSIRYRETVAQIEPLSRLAVFAPALEQAYKEDFELLVTICLAKAVEQRLSRAPEAEKQAALDQALREGYVLTPYFYEKLAEFEEDSRDINRYYPELIEGVDLRRETARIRAVEFVEAPARRERATPQAPQLSAVDKLLQRGEFLMNQEMLNEAREAFEEAREESEGRNAQASYGLARVAILEADPDLARELFLDTVELADDPHLIAMSRVYLGRIEDIVGNRDQAVEHYRLALEAGDPSERTRQLAQQGLDAPFARRSQQREEAPERDPE